MIDNPGGNAQNSTKPITKKPLLQGYLDSKVDVGISERVVHAFATCIKKTCLHSITMCNTMTVYDLSLLRKVHFDCNDE